MVRRLLGRPSFTAFSFWFYLLLALNAARFGRAPEPEVEGFQDGPKIRCHVIIDGVEQEVECS